MYQKESEVQILYRNCECFFCQELEDRTKNPLKKERIVWETKHFVAFPTLGCFQIGYLLIMPKQHYLCFGELDSEQLDELEEIIQKIASYVQTRLGAKCIIFEHGTRDLSQLTSTSIMHAHIHIIPFTADIISLLPNYCELKKVQGFVDLKNEADNYLYLRDTGGNNYIVKNAGYPSQFFRQVACKALGIQKYWIWQDYPFKENMEITMDFYDEMR